MYFVSTMGDNQHQFLIKIVWTTQSKKITRVRDLLMTETEAIIEVRKRIEALEKQLADLEARLPAHSISPNLIAEMDLLDEQILLEKKHIAGLLDKGKKS